jgi:DNA topoisomerase I
VKENSRDPLKGMERPRGKRRLSSTEVALLEFLARGGKRVRRRKPRPEEKAASAAAVKEQAAAQEESAAAT